MVVYVEREESESEARHAGIQVHELGVMVYRAAPSRTSLWGMGWVWMGT